MSVLLSITFCIPKDSIKQMENILEDSALFPN